MQTLRAASLTDEGRELLKRGRLTEELEPPGFEALAGVKANAPRQTSRQQNRDANDNRAARRQAREEAADRLRELRREERELINTALVLECRRIPTSWSGGRLALSLGALLVATADIPSRRRLGPRAHA
jgi:hypothetical protein